MNVGIRSLILGGLWLAGLALANPVGADELPAELYAPDHRVVCNRERRVCFDRYGASIGLTQVFVGPSAAQQLTDALRGAKPEGSFSPAEGVSCRRQIGPCVVGGVEHAVLTAVLFGPWPAERAGRSAGERIVVGVAWKWLGTRYNNATLVQPTDPLRYVLYLVEDGTLRLQVDCNRAGGHFRFEEPGRIAMTVTHSTKAACEPGSLEYAFLRDLQAVTGYVLQSGRLYLDLQYDSGTMGFER